MIDYRPFSKFNPLTSRVPYYPFSLLPSIAFRARELLRHRTVEEIIAIADRINREIEEYFDDIVESTIMDMLGDECRNEERFHIYFMWDGGSSSGQWIFRQEMRDQLIDEMDLPTVQNTSEVDTLKTIFEYRDEHGFFETVEPEPSVYREGEDQEFFAVLSLYLLSDAVKYIREKTTKATIYEYSVAGELSLKAMDAVNYAEHLMNVKILELYHNLKIRDAQGIWEAKHLNETKNNHTKHSEKMNNARHQKRNDAMARVIEEWEKDPTKFPSAEKAGVFFADWLELRGFQYVPRTVTGWVRDHAKKIGVRFR